MGYPHPDHLLSALSARQLAEWESFYHVEPFGDVRADLRMGITVANLLQPYLRPGAKVNPVDLMPFMERPAPETQQDLSARILAAFKTRDAKSKPE